MKDAETVAAILRDATRLCARVRLVPSAGGGLVPALAPADLWRLMPRLLDNIADYVERNDPRPADPAVRHFRKVAGMIRTSPPPAGGGL